MSTSSAYPLVAIVGPTASGKSALAIELALQFNGEVLACDSTQIYRHFDIGTGKVTEGERRGVPHHLLDLLEPEEVFSAGAYRARAIQVLDELRRKHKLPILTVGTGLYLRALLEGLADAPARSEELRARLRKRAANGGPRYLHRVLRKVDAAAAARIAPADEPKIIRAIEVRMLSGKPISDVHKTARPGLPGFAPIKIGLAPRRALLYARIEQRVDTMLARGWLDEVRQRIAGGIPPRAKPFQFIGYSALRAALEKDASPEEMLAVVAAIKQSTRNYAKRQITWFRKEPGVRWFEGFGDHPAILAAASGHLATSIA
jgi:tRNA dimethylallyltransferase